MDRVGLLHQLATLPEHPESVPINALVAVKGTPLQVWLCILHLVTRSPLWMHVVEVKAPTKSLRVNSRLSKDQINSPKVDCASQDQAPPSALDIIRCIATARITMPRSVVRLSAGRLNFSRSDQVPKLQTALY